MKKVITILITFLLLSLLAGCHSDRELREAHDDGYDDGYYAGYEDGMDIGYDNALFDSGSYEEGYSDGYNDGLNDGYEEGYGEGYSSGYYIGMEEMLPDPSREDLGFDIEWHIVDSSMFSEIGYDSEHSVLGVHFLDSGEKYYYLWFYYSDYNRFLAADSLGQYYNEHITGNYYSFRQDGSPTGAVPG